MRDFFAYPRKKGLSQPKSWWRPWLLSKFFTKLSKSFSCTQKISLPFFRTKNLRKKFDLWLLTILLNALYRSSNRDCSLCAHLFLSYQLRKVPWFIILFLKQLSCSYEGNNTLYTAKIVFVTWSLILPSHMEGKLICFSAINTGKFECKKD